jgi:hypothetical protein
MEPIDDILIPRPKQQPRRLRTRHLVRALALILIVGSALYGRAAYYMDAFAPHAQRMSDLFGAGAAVFFGICLWWYAGRPLKELEQPMFGRGSEDPQMTVGRGFWIMAGSVAGFIGMAAVTFGATLALRPEDLKNAFPSLKAMNLSSSPILIIGTLLIVLAGVALALASRHKSGPNER